MHDATDPPPPTQPNSSVKENLPAGKLVQSHSELEKSNKCHSTNSKKEWRRLKSMKAVNLNRANSSQQIPLD